jgi:hypothetical protein
MSRKPHPLTAALEIDFDAVVRATDSYLKEHNLFKDYFALVREETQVRLFEHIDQEIEFQRAVYMELLREFWTLYYEATPYDEQTVRCIVDEHLEAKRQCARAIVEHDLARQEEYDRVRNESLLTRLKWRADIMRRRVRAEWESSTPLEVGLTSAASIVCLWYIAFLQAEPPVLRLMGYPLGAFIGFMCSGIRATEIENRRWQDWRAQLAKKR